MEGHTGVNVHRDRHARVSMSELVQDEGIGDRVQAQPVVGLRRHDAEKAKLAEGRHNVARELPCAIPVRGERRHPRPREFAGDLHHLALRLG